MTEAYVGRASGHFPDRVYQAPASAASVEVVSYPNWLKVLFLAGIILFVASVVGLGFTPLIGTTSTATVLFATAAAGVGALWLVTKLAPGRRA